MNKVNKILVIVIIILSLLVVGMGSYIIYDKVMNDDINVNKSDNDKNNQNTNVDNDGSNNGNVENNIQDSDVDSEIVGGEMLNLSDVEKSLKIVKDVTKKYLDYYYDLGLYCGEYGDDYFTLGSNETQDFRQYSDSSQFKSISEVEKYLKSIMVEELLPSYNMYNGVSYIEKDGKLYCQLSAKGCGSIYIEDDSYYVIDSISDDKIVASGFIVTDQCGGFKDQSRGSVEIVKDTNGNWLMSEYDVEFLNSIYYGE